MSRIGETLVDLQRQQVDYLPGTFNGSDAQLEAAVKHLQELIAKDPRPVPPTPKHPDKSFTPR